MAESPPNRRSAARGRYHHGDLRATLLAAAGAWVAAHGAATFSLRELSRSLGVSHMAAYRHFPDRDSLLAEVAADGFRRLSAAIAAHSRPMKDPASRLRAAGQAYVDFGRKETHLLSLMFGAPVGPWTGGVAGPHQATDTEPEGSPSTAAVRLKLAALEAYASLEAIVNDGVSQGQFDAQSPSTLTLGAWAVVHGLAMLGDSGRIAGGISNAQVDSVLDYWLAGIRKSPSCRSKK